METRNSKKLGEDFNGDRGDAQGADLRGRGGAHGAGFLADGARNLGSASVSMLQDVKLANERLWEFVTHTKVEEVTSRGPEGIVNAAVEGFDLMASALPYLFISTLKIKKAIDGQAAERQARVVVEEQLGLEQQARENVAKQLRLAHERTAQLEADLQAALERATRAEAYSVEMEKKRDAAERARANAFIDGYEELKRKVSAAFPAYDFSGFLPYEASGTDEEDASDDESEDSKCH